MHYVTTKDGRLAAVINNRLIDLGAASIAARWSRPMRGHVGFARELPKGSK